MILIFQMLWWIISYIYPYWVWEGGVSVYIDHIIESYSLWDPKWCDFWKILLSCELILIFVFIFFLLFIWIILWIPSDVIWDKTWSQMIFRVHDDVGMVVPSFNLCFIVKIYQMMVKSIMNLKNQDIILWSKWDSYLWIMDIIWDKTCPIWYLG